MHDCRQHAFSRTNFLAGAGAAATMLLPGARAFAQAPAVPRRFIDIHHHFYPPELVTVMNAWQTKHGQPPLTAYVNLTAEKSLAQMDAAGISVALLSLASPRGVWFEADPKAIPELARACNEFAARQMRDHPGRFGLLAAMPLPDIDASLKEIAYAFDTLHADGVGIPTSFATRWPGDPIFEPFFAELNRRKAVVVFHPNTPNCCLSPFLPGVNDSVLEVPYDTGRAFLNLLTSGTLAKYPDVRYTFAHGGGVLPYLAGRLVSLSNSFAGNLAVNAPDGVEAMLRRMYYDTANATFPATMAALLREIPVSQVMFGTDIPYLTAKQNIGPLDAYGLPAADFTAIAHGNAMRMFPRLQTLVF